jgi:hypothetical protein
MFPPLVLAPASNAGAFCHRRNKRHSTWFRGQGERAMETARNPDPETSNKKYLQTTIGDLSKLYGGFYQRLR